MMKSISLTYILVLTLFSSELLADNTITNSTSVMDSAIVSTIHNSNSNQFTDLSANNFTSLFTKKTPVTTAMAGGGDDEPSDDILGPASEDIFARLKTNFTLSQHTTDLLGDNIDLNNGNVKFNQTDLIVPGNGIGLDIVISRTLRGSDYSFSKQANLGDWTLDIPAIQTTLLRSRTRYSGSWGIGKECSGDIEPGGIYNWGSTYEQYEFWNGDHLQLPNGKNEKLLQNFNGLLTNTNYKRVTKSNWRFSCFNRADGNGEGFIGYAPNGLKYTFDKYRLIASKPLFKDSKPTPRFNAFMMVSKIEDRFGNYIKYNYSGNKLSSITSNDGRSVIFTYGTGSQANFIKTLSYNEKKWTYNYSLHGSSYTLTQVVRPDSKSWTYDMAKYAHTSSPSLEPRLCAFVGNYTYREIVGTITHPDGVTGTFTYAPQIHGRSNVTKRPRGVSPSAGYIQHKCYSNYALKTKVLDGPSLP
jgi:hypothetical protein